jgi:hypothetical protein
MLDLSFLFSSLPDDDSRGGQLRAFGFDPQHFVFTVDDDQGETVYSVSPAELIYLRLPLKNVHLKEIPSWVNSALSLAGIPPTNSHSIETTKEVNV